MNFIPKHVLLSTVSAICFLAFFTNTHADENTIIHDGDTIKIEESQQDTVNLFGFFDVIIQDGRISVERGDGKAPEKERRKDPLEVIDDVETDYLNMDVGINTFTYDEDFTMPDKYREYGMNLSRTRHFRLHIYQQRINLIRQKLNLVHGLAFDFKRFSFSRPVTMHHGLDSVEVTRDENMDYSRNMFRKTDLMLPVYLFYRSNPINKNRSLNIMAGGHVGFNLRDQTRQRTDELRIRNNGDFNVNNFNYGVSVRLGFGRINFYANYELTPVFEEGRGPDLNAFNAGIAIKGIR